MVSEISSIVCYSLTVLGSELMLRRGHTVIHQKPGLSLDEIKAVLPIIILTAACGLSKSNVTKCTVAKMIICPSYILPASGVSRIGNSDVLLGRCSTLYYALKHC
jgi:hypothetical protein